LKVDANRLSLATLAVISVLFCVMALKSAYELGRVERLTFAAGAKDGESYVLALALKQVVEQHHSRIRLEVRETGGTAENLRLLESGAVQLAAAQSDAQVGPAARIALVMFEDKFQLVVREGASMAGFPDLKGKRIALPKTGGQFQSFLAVALHFGLGASDFSFAGADDDMADADFLAGRADAVFRVRALGNRSILRMVRSGSAKLLPITHAAAMSIKHPAFRSSVIPEGAYSGNPAIPSSDLPTVAVQRTLVMHRDLDRGTVAVITGVLMDRRQEIAQAIPEQLEDVRPLLAAIEPPDRRTGLGPPIHPGAIDYYEKDKPSFLQQHADLLALLLTVAVLMGSWIWELKRWIGRRQKNQADQYSHRVLDMMRRAHTTHSPAELEQIRLELFHVFTQAVKDLDADHISEDSFQSFRVVWQTAIDAVREQRHSLPPRSPDTKNAGMAV
jgi:TRAP transporter TAXI family solute receptor